MPSSFARAKRGSILMAPSRSEYWLWRCRWTKGRGTALLPLDRGRGLRRDVVDHPVDALHLVADPARDLGEDLRGHPGPVGRHGILRGDAAHGHGILVGALVAHHAHALYRQEHGEGLPERVVEPRAPDLLHHDRVGAAHPLEALGRHLAEHAHGEARAREGMPPDHAL